MKMCVHVNQNNVISLALARLYNLSLASVRRLGRGGPFICLDRRDCDKNIL